MDLEQNLKCSDTHRPDIDLISEGFLLIEQDFRSQIQNSPRCAFIFIPLKRNPEICYFVNSVLKYHILWLDVPVNHTLLVNRVQALAQIA